MSTARTTTPVQRLLAELGAGSNQVQIHWQRTITLRAGSVRLDLDLDLAKLSERDEQYLTGLLAIIDRFEALRNKANPQRPAVDELLGIAPDWCGDRTVDEHVAWLRDR